jgi:hypothetical protein
MTIGGIKIIDWTLPDKQFASNVSGEKSSLGQI